MVKLLILRPTVADGRAFEVGDIADLSQKDADILRVRGKAELVKDDPLELAGEEAAAEIETATAEPPENAVKPPARRRKRGK